MSDEIDEAEVKEDLSKYYIRVRAKRGQATDSHSLAERVTFVICNGVVSQFLFFFYFLI